MNTNNTMITRWLATPLGPLEIGVWVTDGQAHYHYFEFKSPDELVDPDNTDSHALLNLAETQLNQYFAGERRTFDELIDHTGQFGTEFQKLAWSALVDIPYGETWTYGQQAKYLNKEKAVRAIGAANGKNPLAIVIPCHRVIGANGSLTGYAGGLDKKKWLLNFEANGNK